MKTNLKTLVERAGEHRQVKASGRPLTKRQAQIFAFMKAHANRYGYPPTRAEIADAFDLAVNGVQQHLNLMQRKGVLKLVHAARGIEFTSHD